MKGLKCSEVGFVCPAVIEGETDNEVIQKVEEHVSIVHNIKPENLSSEMQHKIREQIRNTVPS
jgi:predicted small metal-binding protein